MHKILDSVGVELEWATLPRGILNSLRQEYGWRIVRDGSVDSRGRVLHGVIPASAGDVTTLGGEAVSPVIDTSQENWHQPLEQALRVLYDMGEGVDARTSLHVHVNASGLPIWAIHNLLRIGAHLEAGVFRLACGEAGTHRGELLHDFGYCRPITKRGPPITRTDKGCWRPIFTLGGLLNAKNYRELKMACGRYDRHRGSKYVESRYVWLNPVALFQKGTIEFRVFNMTTVPKFAIAWVRLCMGIVRHAFSKIGELRPNPLGTDDITFGEVVEFLELADNRKLISTLDALWREGSFPRGVRGYQRGHLEHQIRWQGTPERLLPPEVEESTYGFNEFDTDQYRMLPDVCKFPLEHSQEREEPGRQPEADAEQQGSEIPQHVTNFEEAPPTPPSDDSSVYYSSSGSSGNSTDNAGTFEI